MYTVTRLGILSNLFDRTDNKISLSLSNDNVPFVLKSFLHTVVKLLGGTISKVICLSYEIGFTGNSTITSVGLPV